SGVISAQPTWVDLTRDGVDDHQYFRGARWPLLGVAYPVLGGTAVLHFSSVLDQAYQGERPVTVQFPSGDLTATDLFDQDGSISSLSVGYARMIGGRTAVGARFGRYSGSVTRQLIRRFDPPPGSAPLEPYVVQSRWRYSGYSVTAGISSDVHQSVRLAASATWSTEIDADARGEDAQDLQFTLPLEVRFGASAVLTPGLVLVASGVWADWSETGADLGIDAADTTLGYGAGLELAQATLFGRSAPLRFGYKRRELPFSPGPGRATEQSWAFGLALNLGQSGETVVASTDLAVERGSRSGGGYDEDFWRATASVSLSSF
ncbi:MAG TPA: hypothetical protein VFQ22_07430, partial [Longimicrobiales bacterium]|nr:hypothetical protein [Longimicrobiales bacterium]